MEVESTNTTQIERAIQGDYQFSPLEAFSRGRELSEGSKWPLNKALAIAFVVLAVVNGVFTGLPSSLATANPDSSLYLALAVLGQLIYSATMLPINTSFTLIGAKRAAGGDIDQAMLWAYFPKTLKLLGAGILIAVAVCIGLMLLVIPGIYLAFSYTFALVLVADKDLGIWEAMETSRKAISKRWFSFAGLLLLLGVVNLIAIIPLGIGLIWSIPWTIITMGEVYRNMFGYEA
jgi:uncharacterized membrane protein